MSDEMTVKCHICGKPYVIYGYSAEDQSACPKCRAEARRRRRVEEMRISKKESCDQCNALPDGAARCILGYSMQRGCFSNTGYPQEPCPKPLNYDEFREAIEKDWHK